MWLKPNFFFIYTEDMLTQHSKKNTDVNNTNILTGFKWTTPVSGSWCFYYNSFLIYEMREIKVEASDTSGVVSMALGVVIGIWTGFTNFSLACQT